MIEIFVKESISCNILFLKNVSISLRHYKFIFKYLHQIVFIINQTPCHYQNADKNSNL